MCSLSPLNITNPISEITRFQLSIRKMTKWKGQKKSNQLRLQNLKIASNLRQVFKCHFLLFKGATNNMNYIDENGDCVGNYSLLIQKCVGAEGQSQSCGMYTIGTFQLTNVSSQVPVSTNKQQMHGCQFAISMYTLVYRPYRIS